MAACPVSLVKLVFSVCRPILVHVNKACVREHQTRFVLQLPERSSGLFPHFKKSGEGDAWFLRGIVKEEGLKGNKCLSSGVQALNSIFKGSHESKEGGNSQ